MIALTKLDGGVIYLNPHQIEYITCNPDTTFTMLSGKSMVVREAYNEVFEKIVAYRKEIGCFKNEE